MMVTILSSSRLARAAFAAAAALFLITLTAAPALAHPLGNFSVNRSSRVVVRPNGVELTYTVDMAEIPAHMARTAMDADGDGALSAAETDAYRAHMAEQIAQGLTLAAGGRPLEPALQQATLELLPGQGGLPTLRLTAVYRAPLALTARGAEFSYADGNFADRLGWSEVVVQAEGVTLLASSAPVESMSAELRAYPADLLQSPPAERRATFTAAPGGGRAVAQTAAASSEQATDPFAELIALPVLGAQSVLLALLAAAGWGAAHALSPGHGKTLAAAYLVGARGTACHALVLGLTTTVTHTAGVFALGLLTLFASRYILPETLYPWLSLISGIIVLGLGASLAWSRFRGAGGRGHHGHHHGHDHSHDHGHGHDHGHPHHDHRAGHPHEHEHPHDHRHGRDDGQSHLPPGADGAAVTWRSLLALGVSGGLLPCPSALVVMLGAITLNRIGFGLLLIVAFSLGLAGVLTAIGIVLVHAGRLVKRIPEGGRLFRLLSAASAVFITLAGAGLTYQALVAIAL